MIVIIIIIRTTAESSASASAGAADHHHPHSVARGVSKGVGWLWLAVEHLAAPCVYGHSPSTRGGGRELLLVLMVAAAPTQEVRGSSSTIVESAAAVGVIIVVVIVKVIIIIVIIVIIVTAATAVVVVVMVGALIVLARSVLVIVIIVVVASGRARGLGKADLEHVRLRRNRVFIVKSFNGLLGLFLCFITNPRATTASPLGITHNFDLLESAVGGKERLEKLFCSDVRHLTDEELAYVGATTSIVVPIAVSTTESRRRGYCSCGRAHTTTNAAVAELRNGGTEACGRYRVVVSGRGVVWASSIY